MPGFDALYKQTVTMFNRIVLVSGEILWRPIVLEKVHLIVGKSDSWSSYGDSSMDTVTLHVRYTVENGEAYIGGRKYYEPKEFRRLGCPEDGITFAYGGSEVCDFFMEGVYEDTDAVLSDDAYERQGFYNYMNKMYDNVFAIQQVSKYNLIPHFEIMAR